VWAIFNKEVRQFLNSLIAYVVIGVFLTGIGLLTWFFPETSVLNYGYADLETLFSMGPFVYMFLIPAITMRMLAEEKKTGTIELLLTRPLTDTQIILGKYFAAFALVIFSVVPTAIYYYSVYKLGNPVGNLDTPGIVGSYIGLVLLGGVFTSIGLLASSLSENQIISFILAVFLCFALFTGVSSVAGLFSGQTALYIEEMSLSYHYDALSRGLVDTRNLLYFFSTTVVMLLLTRLKLSARMLSFKPNRVKVWSSFAVGLLLLFILNVIGANYFKRFDLTEEKRYTLRDSTKELLAQIEQPIHVEILLGSDLPTGFQRLQKSILETVEEFGIYSNAQITYSVNDPGEADTEAERNANYNARVNQGLSPTRIFANEDGRDVQKLIFPYAIISSGGRAAGILLLKGDQGAPAEVKLNQSIEGIEFELAVGMQRLTAANRKRVAIMTGHGELDSLNIQGFVADMIQFYDLQRLDLSQETSIRNFDAVIIAKPQRAFSREDKYKIDQYVMNGGKVIFLIDALAVDMNRAGGEGTFGMAPDLNLDDLFFRYGVRLDKNYVLDIQRFGRYPVMTDNSGTITNLRWPYYFGTANYTPHPITRNLDAIYMRFAGTIDTVAARGITKTPLVYTSARTRVLPTPAPVSFEQIAQENDPDLYQSGIRPIAYLLEGTFTSMFKNRILPKEGVSTSNFKEESVENKMLVISDGDVIRNEIRGGRPLELGLNPFAEGSEQQRYANSDFLFNALAYMIDENGLITARTKEIKLRPLDRLKVREERLKWQLINLLGPVLLIVIFGLLRSFIRKRRYSRF
jgi:ABC-2 type transport system permease protein